MKDYIAGIGALLVSAYIYFASESFAVAGGGLAKNPAYYPRALALLLAALAVCLLVNALIQKKKPGITINKELLKNVGAVFGLILLYVICFEFVGFIVSTLAFIVCGILMYGGSVKTAVLCGVPVTAAMYFIFHIIMQVAMPNGILF